MSGRTLFLIFLAVGLMAFGVAGSDTDATFWTIVVLASWLVAFVAGMSTADDDR